MDRRDSYLFKAAELLELSKNEHHAEFEAEFENLALAYLRLAEQAKQKDYLDIDSETHCSNKMVVPNLGSRFLPVRAYLKCHSAASPYREQGDDGRNHRHGGFKNDRDDKHRNFWMRYVS